MRPGGSAVGRPRLSGGLAFWRSGCRAAPAKLAAAGISLVEEAYLAGLCLVASTAVAATHHATSIDLDADFRRAPATGEPEAQQKARHLTQRAADAVESPGATEGGTESENALDLSESRKDGHAAANADKVGGWALQDSNSPTNPSGKQGVSGQAAQNAAHSVRRRSQRPPIVSSPQSLWLGRLSRSLFAARSSQLWERHRYRRD